LNIPAPVPPDSFPGHLERDPLKKLIAYDLDGTLVDTRQDIVLSANHMLSAMGRPLLAAETIHSYVGRGLFDLIQSCLGTRDEKEIGRGARIYRRYYSEHMMDHTLLYPGAMKVLHHFKDRKQAVVTNKPSPFSEQMLESLGAADFLCGIVTGSSKHPPKPDPSAILEVLEKEKILPEEALFVGDSEVDFQTACSAGIDAVLIAHGFVSRDKLESLSPKWLVDNFEELLQLALKQSW